MHFTGSLEEKCSSNGTSSSTFSLPPILLAAPVCQLEKQHFVPYELKKPTKTEFSVAIHTHEFNAEGKLFKLGLLFKNLDYSM